jgi:predicted nuclease of predicted toxin-antitoxin system
VLRLISDENFDGDILRGLFRRNPALDIIRVQDVGLTSATDPDVLAWAATEGRIVLTHDRTTARRYLTSPTIASEPPRLCQEFSW